MSFINIIKVDYCHFIPPSVQFWSFPNLPIIPQTKNPANVGWMVNFFDLTYAYVQNQRPETLEQICLMTDYWWGKRDEVGLLLIESRSPKEAERFFGNNAPTQTLSLGASLLESALSLEAKKEMKS